MLIVPCYICAMKIQIILYRLAGYCLQNVRPVLDEILNWLLPDEHQSQ